MQSKDNLEKWSTDIYVDNDDQVSKHDLWIDEDRSN